MDVKHVLCLLLALTIVVMCFAGCRNKKEDELVTTPDLQAAEAEQSSESEAEIETGSQDEAVDITPEIHGGLAEEGELVIEVPEGSEIGGD